MLNAETAAPSRFAGPGGALAVVLTVALIGGLDLHRAVTNPHSLRRTISEYALGPQKWVFDVGVLLLAAGSVAILVALVRAGVARWWSPGAVAMALWSAGLTLVVLFPKHNWAMGGPSASGTVHRVASVLAFLSLPVAALLLSRPWLRSAAWGAHARRVFALGWLSVLALSPLVYALLVDASGGTAWWRVFPLGYVERALVLVEVVAVLAAGSWATAVGKRPRVA
ncbi:DUF998 domain-containing protein [Actinosynnema pretiosum]|uniref:DUF998 domain-containing protein n=2 Tax=Actinosynnema TaxID=40566 RepID=A0A290ZBG9_9PSEU|nr:DUF998 domain-containing protein [Actinosynnema pretiosum]ATE56358.1 hypothetical protein CNX65_26355 [Actinosynnema pretiosum]